MSPENILYPLVLAKSFDGSVASATLLAYDIALTFEQEVRGAVVIAITKPGSRIKLLTYNLYRYM